MIAGTKKFVLEKQQFLEKEQQSPPPQTVQPKGKKRSASADVKVWDANKLLWSPLLPTLALLLGLCPYFYVQEGRAC